jgi:hypothetical protein
MRAELSMAELDAELSAELPDRTMLRRRRHRGGVSAFASHGSVANANHTTQINFNPQIVVNNGRVSGSGISISSHNSNHNTTNQTGVPINFSI